jgi:hypothetical protein
MGIFKLAALAIVCVAAAISSPTFAQNKKGGGGVGPDGCRVGDRACCDLAVTRMNQRTPGAYLHGARKAARQRCMQGQKIGPG